MVQINTGVNKMATNIAVGFSLWWYTSDGSSDTVTIDLRTAPVCFFYPAYSPYNVDQAPEVSEEFDITKLTPVGFVIGSYSASSYEGEQYSYFTPTSNSGYSLSGYELTVSGVVGSSNTLNQVCGMLLF
jgi:hypothetical protein